MNSKARCFFILAIWTSFLLSSFLALFGGGLSGLYLILLGLPWSFAASTMDSDVENAFLNPATAIVILSALTNCIFLTGRIKKLDERAVGLKDENPR